MDINNRNDIGGKCRNVIKKEEDISKSEILGCNDYFW